MLAFRLIKIRELQASSTFHARFPARVPISCHHHHHHCLLPDVSLQSWWFASLVTPQ